MRERFERRSSLFSQDSAILLAFRLLQYCDRILAVLLSVFFSQVQAHSKGLWVFCAEMGVAWHILGAGEV